MSARVIPFDLQSQAVTFNSDEVIELVEIDAAEGKE